jgi:hypothetical protein
MKRRLRRELRLLHAYAIASLLALAFLATAAFTQRAAAEKAGEITVQRINVVDANGTLRLVLAGKDRMHPGVIDGKVIDRRRPVGGLIFFNDDGDEVGGLTFRGEARDGHRRAEAGFTFDQLKQDQTIGLSYSETDGRRSAGLQVWDRSDTPLGELVDRLNAANKMTDLTARDAELAKIRASAPPGSRRLFVGKNTDRAALVSLADAQGKPRLTLKVDADGSASIEFLDEAGKVTQRFPQPKN